MEWERYGEARHTRTFYLCPNPAKAKYVYKLARLELGRFVRVVTGHNNLSSFQNKLGLAPPASCRLCGEGDETITISCNNARACFEPVDNSSGMKSLAGPVAAKPLGLASG